LKKLRNRGSIFGGFIVLVVANWHIVFSAQVAQAVDSYSKIVINSGLKKGFKQENYLNFTHHLTRLNQQAM